MICHLRIMNTTELPKEPYLQISWNDLETAWRMLAAPDKSPLIKDTLLAVQSLYQSDGPEKAVFNMIAATAYLTDDGPKNGHPRDGARSPDG